MVEKKQIVYELMLKYSGPLSVEDFYGEVDKWAGEKGLEKELKRKSEEVKSKGKRIEYVVELWKSPVRAVKHMIRLRVLFDNVREIKKKSNNREAKFNEANVFINIDGWLETSLKSRWTQTNPIYTLFRTLYDKYIWGIGQNIGERYEGGVQADCYDLHKRLKSFFELYKTSAIVLFNTLLLFIFINILSFGYFIVKDVFVYKNQIFLKYGISLDKLYPYLQKQEINQLLRETW